MPWQLFPYYRKGLFLRGLSASSNGGESSQQLSRPYWLRQTVARTFLVYKSGFRLMRPTSSRETFASGCGRFDDESGQRSRKKFQCCGANKANVMRGFREICGNAAGLKLHSYGGQALEG
jgi:hypothetical protein